MYRKSLTIYFNSHSEKVNTENSLNLIFVLTSKVYDVVPVEPVESKKVLRTHKCSFCHQSGHNKAKCPRRKSQGSQNSNNSENELDAIVKEVESVSVPEMNSIDKKFDGLVYPSEKSPKKRNSDQLSPVGTPTKKKVNLRLLSKPSTDEIDSRADYGESGLKKSSNSDFCQKTGDKKKSQFLVPDCIVLPNLSIMDRQKEMIKFFESPL